MKSVPPSRKGKASPRMLSSRKWVGLTMTEAEHAHNKSTLVHEAPMMILAKVPVSFPFCVFLAMGAITIENYGRGNLSLRASDYHNLTD